ncbi:MAG: hypothetical protein KVP17_005076 [Porospora cf. gigantea B]|uniref:uncharacterized protein n=1 Tax=Porospora cf. gigantea B TaxID=2853592 RepID=UPI0035719B39|nr:MAG: hypothetical protein KVP17_005076 [Porospora cf. gigantea B]
MTFKIPEIPPLPLHLVERCMEPIPTYNRLPVDENFDSSEEYSSELCSDDDFISTGLPESYRHTHRRVVTSRLPREEYAKRKHTLLLGMQNEDVRSCMTTRPRQPKSGETPSVASLQSAETPRSTEEASATPIPETPEAPPLKMQKKDSRLSRYRRMIRRFRGMFRRMKAVVRRVSSQQ